MNLFAQLQIPNQPGVPGAPPQEPPPDIRDIVPPDALPDYLQIALTALLVSLAICLIAIAVFYFLRWNKRRLAYVAPPPPPAEAARAALEQLRADAPNLSPNELSLGASNIIKEYFHARYGDRLLFETSEEFATRENHKKSIPHSKRVALGEFFEHCDQLKFARTPDAAHQAPALLEEAAALLQESAIPEATISETQFVLSSRKS